MELKDIKAVYFIGAGGIGMSAIARYFIHKGLVVAGYDRTPSDLTRHLEKEGMLIHYEETSTKYRTLAATRHLASWYTHRPFRPNTRNCNTSAMAAS